MTINATVASTISKQCYNTSNECNNYYYSYPSEYNMDIPLHSYMYTLFLGIGCYSLLNPAFMRRMMVNIGFSIANALLGGFIIYNEHIYKPFNKYIYKPLVYILNIQEKEDEIMIIKDGVVIHSFKTMDEFIKQQPINFVCDEEDEDVDDEDDVDEDDEGSSEEENSNQETIVQGEGDENKSSNNESDGKIVDTVIDADLTQLSTDIHESEPGEGENENKSGDEDEEPGVPGASIGRRPTVKAKRSKKVHEFHEVPSSSNVGGGTRKHIHKKKKKKTRRLNKRLKKKLTKHKKKKAKKYTRRR